jgi:hypothetical protein
VSVGVKVGAAVGSTKAPDEEESLPLLAAIPPPTNASSNTHYQGHSNNPCPLAAESRLILLFYVNFVAGNDFLRAFRGFFHQLG